MTDLLIHYQNFKRRGQLVSEHSPAQDKPLSTPCPHATLYQHNNTQRRRTATNTLVPPLVPGFLSALPKSWSFAESLFVACGLTNFRQCGLLSSFGPAATGWARFPLEGALCGAAANNEKNNAAHSFFTTSGHLLCTGVFGVQNRPEGDC